VVRVRLDKKGTHTRGAAELPRAREDFGV
jgi:hypothetical protein